MSQGGDFAQGKTVLSERKKKEKKSCQQVPEIVATNSPRRDTQNCSSFLLDASCSYAVLLKARTEVKAMQIKGCAGRSRICVLVSHPVHTAGRRAAADSGSCSLPPPWLPPAVLNTFSKGAFEGAHPAPGYLPHLDP